MKMTQNILSQNEQLDKLLKEQKHARKVMKVMERKLDTITTQTKKKIPQKRPPKPKEETEKEKKKVQLKLNEIKKILVEYK